jgi:hypothetical protein
MFLTVTELADPAPLFEIIEVLEAIPEAISANALFTFLLSILTFD